MTNEKLKDTLGSWKNAIPPWMCHAKLISNNSFNIVMGTRLNPTGFFTNDDRLKENK